MHPVDFVSEQKLRHTAGAEFAASEYKIIARFLRVSAQHLNLPADWLNDLQYNYKVESTRKVEPTRSEND